MPKVQSLREQEKLARTSSNYYVGMLATKGSEWSWYISRTFGANSAIEVEAWYQQQRGICRVYSNQGKLILAK